MVELADVRPRQVIGFGSAVLLLGWVALSFAVTDMVATLVLLFFLGMLWFAVGSTLVARALETAWEAPMLGGGFSTAAFNVGAALGPLVGGLGIDAGLGYRSPIWGSAVLMGVALLVMGWFRLRDVTPVEAAGRPDGSRRAHMPQRGPDASF